MAGAWCAELAPLRDALSQAGRPAETLAFADGSRLLVLPAGGRVLGLFAPGGEESFLWANPALETAQSAAAYLAREGWPNPGGDRTWLAPEVELFIADLGRPGETYAVPPALDPGHWTLAAASASALTLTNQTRLRLRRAGGEIGVRIGKSLSPADNPLSGTPLAGAGLRCAGYTQVTTLEVEPGAGARLGLWNLLQLPPPGEMLVATRGPAAPRQVFGVLAADELTLEPRLVRWRMGGPGVDAKIALRAPGLTGRAGYLGAGPRPGEADLVVREFEVDPGGEYVDALWEPPHETGWAFQACCVRTGAERFNELEYHAPAAAGGGVTRDESRVWAFRGPEAAIQQAAELLLGA
jgi:hypothetical protein